MKKPDYVLEPAKKIPVYEYADIVVCGGGTAGLAAAVCAGRLGLKVIMLEQSSMAGGMISHFISGLQDCTGKGGFVRELTAGMEQRGMTDPSVKWCVKYNRFQVPYYLDELIEQAGVHPLYRCLAVAPVLEDGAVTGVFVESKSGRFVIKASLVVDATGDGDIASRAGADHELGRPGDGRCQAVSAQVTFLEYSGARMDKPEFSKRLREASARAGYALPYDHERLKPMFGTRHTWASGTPHVDTVDATDAASLSRALIQLRQQAWGLYRMLKSQVSDFAEASLGPIAELPGVRESRRIVCDAKVTSTDLSVGRRRPDGIFTISQSIDIHRRDANDPSIIIKSVKPYHLPYGALLPQGVENLLVVGRCIGGDHEALASYRVAGDCLAMGEAAARAAGLALKRNCSLRAIPAQLIAAEMKQLGYTI